MVIRAGFTQRRETLLGGPAAENQYCTVLVPRYILFPGGICPCSHGVEAGLDVSKEGLMFSRFTCHWIGFLKSCEMPIILVVRAIGRETRIFDVGMEDSMATHNQ